MYPIHESSSGSKRRHDISGGGGPAVLNHQRNNIDANTNINIHININPFNSLVDQWPSPTWGTLEQAPLLLSRNDPSSSDGGGGGSGSGGADGADDHGTPVDLATIRMQYPIVLFEYSFIMYVDMKDISYPACLHHLRSKKKRKHHHLLSSPLPLRTRR